MSSLLLCKKIFLMEERKFDIIKESTGEVMIGRTEMTTRELSYEEINQVTEQLQRERIDISRNVVVTMLDTGILTEPRKLDDYLRAKEIGDKYYKGFF